MRSNMFEKVQFLSTTSLRKIEAISVRHGDTEKVSKRKGELVAVFTQKLKELDEMYKEVQGETDEFYAKGIENYVRLIREIERVINHYSQTHSDFVLEL